MINKSTSAYVGAALAAIPKHNLSRLKPLLPFFALCSTLLASALADRPNIIVILTDDQGWGDLSVHGNTNLSTPNIDRLAERGMEFERFYVCPICSPTRAEFHHRTL